MQLTISTPAPQTHTHTYTAGRPPDDNFEDDASTSISVPWIYRYIDTYIHFIDTHTHTHATLHFVTQFEFIFHKFLAVIKANFVFTTLVRHSEFLLLMDHLVAYWVIYECINLSLCLLPYVMAVWVSSCMQIVQRETLLKPQIRHKDPEMTIYVSYMQFYDCFIKWSNRINKNRYIQLSVYYQSVERYHKWS